MIMNPVVITIVGIIIACGILLWAALEISRRVRGNKKRDAGVMHRWVPLRVADNPDDDGFAAEREDPEHDSGFDVHSRTQQNGHHSGSKYKQR
jgi:hypothetical protein